MESSAEKPGSTKPFRKPMLSLEQRSEIVQHLEGGVSIRRVAAEFDIHRTTVHRIRRSADMVTQFLEEHNGRTKRRNIRKSVYEELDHRLYTWFLERKANCKSMLDSIVSDKAVEINKELGGPADFKASRGWIVGFKKRHCIRMRYHLSRPDPNAVYAQEFISRFAQQIEEEGIEYENVYSMNETSLLWKALPLKTNVQWEERSVKLGKLNKDRVTVSFCTNATGSHKHAPLFIHRFESPRVLKHAKHKLPVIYKFHENTTLDQTLFVDWYQNHFKPDVMKYQLQHGTCGKVILLLDNYRTYTFDILQQFKNDERFEIVLLPPNTSHLIQPIDRLIPKTKKSYYDKMSRIAKCSNEIKDFCTNYDLKDCINLLYEAWSEIDAADIREAWRSLIKGIPKVLDIEKEDDFFEFNRREMEDSTNRNGEPVNRTVECSSGELTTNNDGLEISEATSLSNAVANEENISRTFRTLMLWSQKQPKIIELNMKCLQNYYEGR